ncbi:MAG: hypothetical protein RSF30_09475, partial [Lachnospiraceae bacterium]
MRLIFNDGTELQVQQVYIDSAGAMRIKTISATQEQLRVILSDPVKTKKMTVEERGQVIDNHENYTKFEGITVYNAGILEPFLYKTGETPAERLDAAETAVTQTQMDMQMAVAELTMVIAALTEVLTGGTGGDGNV